MPPAAFNQRRWRPPESAGEARLFTVPRGRAHSRRIDPGGVFAIGVTLSRADAAPAVNNAARDVGIVYQPPRAAWASVDACAPAAGTRKRDAFGQVLREARNSKLLSCDRGRKFFMVRVVGWFSRSA